MTSFLLFLQFQLRLFGTIFSLVGIIFFFAFHWQDLPKFGKFGILFLTLLASTIYSIFSRGESQKKELSYLVSVMLIGQILFVFGQTYQTGANSFYLFFAWLVFSAPFVFSSLSVLSVFPWLHLGTLSISLFFSEIYYVSLDSFLFIPLILWNVFLFFGFRQFSELIFRKRYPFLESYFFSLVVLLILTELISGIFHDWNHLTYKLTTFLGLLSLFGFFTLFYFVYQYFVGLVILCFAFLILSCAYIIVWIDLDSFLSFFLISLYFASVTFFLIQWLKTLPSRWEK